MTNLTREQVEEAALVLENDGDFYRAFIKHYERGYKVDAADVRNLIQRNLRRLKLREGQIEDRESLRLYFEDRYELPTKTLYVTTPTYNLLEPEKATTKVATVATQSQSQNQNQSHLST